MTDDHINESNIDKFEWYFIQSDQTKTCQVETDL
jgi:hypothetical protein